MRTVRSTQHAALLSLSVLTFWCAPVLAQSTESVRANTGTLTAPEANDSGAIVWPVVADPNVDPVGFAVTQRLSDKAVTKGYHPDDVAALTRFYKDRTEAPIWVGRTGFTDRARSAKVELSKADHWGLEAKDYQLPAAPAEGASANQRAKVELDFAFTILKYARHARSGRVNPSSVTRINDFPGPKKDVATVLDELVETSDIRASLRELHPKHPEFERLRRALLKARGISTIETGALPKPRVLKNDTGAAKVTLPNGDEVLVGMQHKDVVLLRQRLGVEADIGANTHYFDEPLAEAVRAFQTKAGLVANGHLDQETRKRLNARLMDAERDAKGEDDNGEEDVANTRRKPNSRTVQLILNNMERWRWLPEDMGDFYVWNNVPEFRARVFKGKKAVFSEKIIVGLPEWATPSFMADMKYVIFHPSWGVPSGIKLKELLPRLQRAQPQSLFDFFGGGGGSAAVFRAYNLNVYKNGQQINPNGITWTRSNILNYSFVQPPGGKNPLGKVKFRFPNKHAVYMHDTIEPELFSKSRRAYSHGCIRVRNPIRLAEVLLGHDKGYAPEAVRRMARSGRSVELNQDVPVYVTYMTARVDDNGRLQTYGDIYGRDSRLARQMGRAMRFDPPKVAKPNSDAQRTTRSVRKKRKKKKKSASSGSTFPSSMRQAISGRYN